MTLQFVESIAPPMAVQQERARQLFGAIRPGAASVLPDEVVELKSAWRRRSWRRDAAAHGHGDSYWTPDPDTGVFGPEDDRHGQRRSGNARGGGSSVPEENAWIRHLEVEDAEKLDPAAAMD
ncbi:uncharacterized protein LOC122010954 [Zingiber officinale]|uniref:uncharacterized protein LOC122010954 n=1 Tax=Zingiber officinale TaxID=94328 RepID=UPI001C4B0477|nr:uncharacterized protein LOC122010954 [Zingiber officinale]